MMKCQSCGRQSESTFCKDCANDAGELKRFDEIVESLIGYYVETQGFDTEVAKSVAIEILSRQPAWEKKIKKEERTRANFKKMSIVFMAIVVALTSGGIVYWLTSAKPAKSIVTYQNISSKSVSPFDNIIEKEVNGLQVFEIRCAGDQQLCQLSDNILTFKSLEGTKKSLYYKLFNMDLDHMLGYPFVPSSLETRSMLSLMNDYLILPNIFKDNKKSNWVYSPDKGLLHEIEGDLSMNKGDYCLIDDYNHFEIYNLRTDNKKEIQKKGFIDSKAIVGGKVIIMDGNDLLIYDIDAGKLESKISNTPMVHYLKHVSSRYLPLETSLALYGESHQKDDKSVERSEASRLASIEKRISNNINVFDAETLRFIDTSFNNVLDFLITDSMDLTNTWMYYRKYDNNRSITYCYNLATNTVQTVQTDGDVIYPIATTDRFLVFSKCFNKYSTISQDDLTKIVPEETLFDLWLFDPISKKIWKLEDKIVDNIMVSNQYISWVKWSGEGNDQYFNISFAQTPPQRANDKIIDKSESKATIESRQVGNIELSEVNQVGDQSPFVVNVDNRLSNNHNGYLFYQTFISDKGDYQIKKVDFGNRTVTDFYNTSHPIFKDDVTNFYTVSYDYLYDNDYYCMNYEPLSDSIDVNKIENTDVMGITIKQDNDHFHVYYSVKGEKYELLRAYHQGAFIYLYRYEFQDDLICINSALSQSLYYFDKKNKRFTYISKAKDLISYNSRYILFANGTDGSSLVLFDKETLRTSARAIDFGNTGCKMNECYINDGKKLDELILVWQYVKIENSKRSTYLAYYFFANDNGTLQIKKIDTTWNLAIDAVLGKWTLFHIEYPYVINTKKYALYAYNVITNEKIVIDGNYVDGSMMKQGDYLYWMTDRGYLDKQFKNICFAKIK